LTTGQASPTTPIDTKTKSTPEWNHARPFDPIALAKAAGCAFSFQALDRDLAGLTKLIVSAIQHQGFSHINVDQACPSRRKWWYRMEMADGKLQVIEHTKSQA
jgi:2-oxoglutarate ferredoxin oxidoreductase subunit beta